MVRHVLSALMVAANAACSAGGGPPLGNGSAAGDDAGPGALPDPITVSVDFENLEGGDLVSGQYGPDVTFEPDEGYVLYVLDMASQAGAGPKFICVRPEGGGNCTSSGGFKLALSADLVELSVFVPPVGVQNDPGRMVFLDEDGDVLGAQDVVEGDNTVASPPAGTRSVWFTDVMDGGGVGYDDFVVTVQPAG